MTCSSKEAGRNHSSGSSSGFLHLFLLPPLQPIPQTTCRRPSQIGPATTLKDFSVSLSPSHLEEEANKGVHKGILELPKKGIVGQGREEGKSGFLLQHLQTRSSKERCILPYPSPGQVSQHLVEATGLF